MEIKFKKVHTAKDLIISILVIAAGVGLYFVNQGLGGVIGVCGLLLLFFYKAGYKREGEGILLTKKALDVSHSCRDSLKNFLEGKEVEPQIDTTAIGGIIRLEVYYNADSAVAYAQIYDVAENRFDPATQLVELKGDKVRKLIAQL